jgi:hypothetical protein
MGLYQQHGGIYYFHGGGMTTDFMWVITLFGKLANKRPGRSFQHIIGDIHENIYNTTGLWDDPDVDEIGNDEYARCTIDLIFRSEELENGTE